MTVPEARDTGLRHTLTPRLVSLVAVGGVIGAGLFVGSSFGLTQAGAAILPGYVLAGLLVMIQMRILADTARRNPAGGSFIGQIRQALGSRAGFVAGWAYVLFWGSTAGSEVIAAGPLFHRLTGLPDGFGSIGALALTLMVNLVSARAYGRVEAVLSITKVAAIAVFVVLGVVSWAVPGLFAGGAGFDASRIAEAGLAPHGWLAAAAILPILVQSLTGFEIATVAAMESTDPIGSVDAASRTLVPRVGLLYVGSLAIILGIVPHDQIIVGSSPFATVLERLGLASGAQLLGAVVLVAVTSCLNSALYAASRVIYELAATSDAPERMAHTNRSSVPVNAVLTAAAIECLVALLGVASPGHGYVVALSLASMLILATYLLASVAGAVLRRRGSMRRAWRSAWRETVAIIGIGGVILGLAASRDGMLNFILGLACLLALCMVAYMCHRNGPGRS